MINKNTILCALLMMTAAAAPAHATKTVTSPYVAQGRMTAEWRGGYEEDRNGEDAFKTRNQLSYGFTDFYDLKVSVDTADEGDAEFTDIDIENKFQLLPRGEYWVDLGLRIDFTRSLNGGSDGAGGKILLGKQTGEFSHLLNLEAGREIGGESSSNDWGYGLAYGIAYPLSEDLSLGGEYYADFGDFGGGYSDQDHRAGPVIYGTAFGAIRYQAGVLAGLSNEAPDATLKATASYSFQF